MRTLAIILTLCLASCDKSNPVAPPPPTINGGWDITLTGPGGTGTALMNLTDNGGSVTGTFQIAAAILPCSGTLSSTGVLFLSVAEYPFLYYLNSTVNSARNSMSGTLRVEDWSTSPPTQTGTLQLSAVKR